MLQLQSTVEMCVGYGHIDEPKTSVFLKKEDRGRMLLTALPGGVVKW
jgi:hypothetical protein